MGPEKISSTPSSEKITSATGAEDLDVEHIAKLMGAKVIGKIPEGRGGIGDPEGQAILANYAEDRMLGKAQ